MDKVVVKEEDSSNIEDLKNLSKEELIERIQSLTAHNIQLKNVLARSSATDKAPKRVRKPFDFDKCSYRHILIKFLYLGWDYHGYAVQEDTINTIENYLFDALRKTCLIKDRSLSNYHRCGRTDKGVSACGQVISIDVRSKLVKENQHKLEDEIDYCKVLNSVLPKDIRCIAWSPVSENFSARFDCKARTYKYFFPREHLNIEKMIAASKHLVGTHDFRNFCKMDVANGVVKFIRNIISIDIIPTCKEEDEGGDEYTMYVAVIKARAFLWHQIRCIMGILFLIGDNKESPDIIKELLNVDKNPRKPDYNMASEIPLNLYCCEYDEEIDWYYKYDVLIGILQKLKVECTFELIKSAMVRSMINDLQVLVESCVDKKFVEQPKTLTNCLIQGVKSKIYMPVMDRQRCDSLKDRIMHYAKKSRMDFKEDVK